MRRQRWPLLALVVVGVLAAEVLALAGKQLTQRPRPSVRYPEPEPLMRTPLDLALPSGHAATSFAGATVLALLVPRLAWPLFALAAAIACSRVYVGVHYPGDVLAGAALGTVVGLTTVKLWRRDRESPAVAGTP